ncbi:L-seryl-tRNA(Sec) selenium transferase [Oceanisphaera pacifica]|uniref:L-seryl-tRNA(Sec) selenium transferase n=1 Tax=Oceanisphaera pacifica TaxID=2818389 RepID=A0ABS3NCG5_9GAMM|nr:L-seryl-tRNA(Sec) selenium transferase [Oceanisphaera pacifica]MBO1518225.1 L-seryl-tRNA(Sec) selenium transferase [Oceanisphaera pacifica]
MTHSSPTATTLHTLAQPADLPALDKVLHQPELKPCIQQYGLTLVTQQLRELLAHLRTQALSQQLPLAKVTADHIIEQLLAKLEQITRSELKTVINLTGTVLHTNLGRALLPDSAVQAVAQVLTQPTNLEFDLNTGKRGDRDTLVEALICDLTEAEAATVVNNNAAAVLLMLSALAPQKDVIVSRGELVEIGGSFRIPDIMSSAGSTLKEVGTTNRTHYADYERAIGEQTAMLMKVHCSNYAVVGFTKETALSQLVTLGQQHHIPVTMDLGSGTLVDLAQWGLPHEPTVKEILQSGVDLVTFSGDKLLGGPQAGFIVGRKILIDKIKKHPLKRALRVGKLTMAALESVLALYRSPEYLPERLTTLSLLTREQSDIAQQAKQLQPSLQQAVGQDFEVSCEPMYSQIGSGAMPVESLPSFGLVIRYLGQAKASRHIMQLERKLRTQPLPIIGRIHKDALYLDCRCLSEQHAHTLNTRWSTIQL